ncbi:MAG TPA: ankyrin repeat domain-containing protein, partial [Rhizomicrobium sp.]|nr:ankyrin repeat domain-containing protein [Rhizomicrobium sp.]
LESGVSLATENRFGWTLLMLAAMEGNIAIGQLLIASGAEVNKATSMGIGQTALTLAAVGGHVRFLKLLLDHGANPDAGEHPIEAWLPACRLSPKAEAEILAILEKFRSKNSN